MIPLLLLAPLLAPVPQTDWVKAGHDWFTQWKTGRIELQLAWPRSNPYVLDAGDPRIEELLRAKGTGFVWTHEAELAMVCSGLAADMSGRGRELLRELALTPNGGRPGAELRAPAVLARQPWIVRKAARDALARSADEGSRRAAVAVLEDQGADEEAMVLACALLGVCGDFSQQVLLAGLLDHPAPLVRVAAAQALGHIGGELALEALLGRLDGELEPRVRGHLWSALILPVENLGDWRERAEKELWKKAVAAADRRLFAESTSMLEKLAIAEFLWRTRPEPFLPRLPDALAAAQGDEVGKARLRWWLHGLLADMIGSAGSPRRRAPDGSIVAAGPDPGPTEVEAWRKLVAERPTPQTRRSSTNQPPLPRDGIRLFGLPVEGRRLLFLVDSSAVLTGSWAVSTTQGSEEDRKAKVDEMLAVELAKVLAALPDGTELRLATLGKGLKTTPRRGWLNLDTRSRIRLGKVLAGLRGSGEVDLSTPLFATYGVERGFPVNLGAPDEDRPDAIYLLASPLVREGPVQSPEALVDLIAGAWAGSRVPCFVAFINDRRPTTSDPGYRLRGPWSTALRRLAAETRAGMGYAQPSTRRD